MHPNGGAANDEETASTRPAVTHACRHVEAMLNSLVGALLEQLDQDEARGERDHDRPDDSKNVRHVRRDGSEGRSRFGRKRGIGQNSNGCQNNAKQLGVQIFHDRPF